MLAALKRLFGFNKDVSRERMKETPPPKPLPPPTPELLTLPWRKSPSLDTKRLLCLKEKVGNYRAKTKILLLGRISAGKSSYFNTINNIFQERLTQMASAGSITSGMTVKFQEFQIRSEQYNGKLNFRVCDTGGIGENNGPNLSDLNYILRGNVPNGYVFNPRVRVDPSIPPFNEQPSMEDRIHCVGFVVDASSISGVPETIWKLLNELQQTMNILGVPRIVLLTKIDIALKRLPNGVYDVFKSNEVRKAVDKISEILHVPRGNVMPVKNYEDENELDDAVSCLALEALDRMLGYAKDFVDAESDLLQSIESRQINA